MSHVKWRVLIAVLGLSTIAPLGASQAGPQPVVYRISFPAAAHHVADVEVTFSDLGTQPLHAMMSRSSAGRYALHEFAKNVYDVEAADGADRPVAITRPSPYPHARPASLPRRMARLPAQIAPGSGLQTARDRGQVWKPLEIGVRSQNFVL
jgi:hypothetical protein